jgi:flagellar basal body-associated protein FliL
MGSSDREEDIEGYIDKALDEGGKDQRPVSDLGHLEEFSEEYLFEDKVREPLVLDEPQEQESQPVFDLEDLEKFVEEPLFETKEPRPAVPDEPQKKESQPGSDEESLGAFEEEHLFEDKAWEPLVLDEPQEQESKPGSDEESLGALEEEHLFEDKAWEPPVSDELQEQDPETGSEQEHLGELKDEYFFEEGPQEPAVPDHPQEQELHPSADQKSLEESKEEHLFEDKAWEPPVPDELQEQEPQPDSDQEHLGELKEDYPFEKGPEQAGEGETEADTQEINLRSRKKRKKGGRRVVASVAIPLIALIGIGAGYLYLNQERIAGSPNQGTGPGQSVSIAIPREEILTLDSFVIPAEGNKDFTYVFLSISVKLPNKEVKREVAEKESSLRGIIYDTLVREIAKTRDVPPPESLKEFIIRGVNGALSTGRISEVFISKFLAL